MHVPVLMCMPIISVRVDVVSDIGSGAKIDFYPEQFVEERL